MKAEFITPPIERVIRIEMTEREAKTFRIICSKISGSPFLSRRRDADSLDNVLEDLGVELLYVPHKAHDYITFEDDE